MAIYHLSTKNISRAQGRSAVGCAAYRSGEKLHDERQDKIHDYTRKQDVLHSEIMLPENAPSWMGDREKLWNHVESCEKRKDSRLARECEISLPRELTFEQNLALAKEFVQREFVDKGMVADLAIHQDKDSNGELQPHMHVMLTTRELTPDGFGQKVTDWNRKELLLTWREHWADTANRHLALHGHDMQIDHRSYAAQGINLEPQHKIGSVAAQEHSSRLADHQRIARENGERIYKDPSVALHALTHQSATFTHHDLARFVNRQTVDAEQFERVFTHVKASPELVLLGKDDQGRDRFTSREMLALEKNIMAQTDTLHERANHRVSDGIKDAVLSRYPTLSDEQKAAFMHLTDAGDLKPVIGYAGTGKSFVLGAAREAWEAQGYRVQGAALAGIAAENLTNSAGIESRTIASRIAAWDRGEQRLTSKDVLVVDEAGLIGSRQMARIMEEVHASGAKYAPVGDPQQLQAIEAGAIFRAMTERTGYVELTEVRRQHTEWQREATKEFANGEVEKALARYEKHDHLHEFDTRDLAKQGMVELWNDARLNEPDKSHLMLAYTRVDVKDLNERARELLKANHELGDDHTIQTARGDREFATGDHIQFLRNDRQLGVMNGTLGTIAHIDEKNNLSIRLDSPDKNPENARTISVDTSSYDQIDHGYAATYHKAQGATVDRNYMLASRHVDSHASYVGFTRHRESVDMCWSRDEFKNTGDLAQSLARDRSKDVAIDYAYEFSAHREIDYSSPTSDREPVLENEKKYAEHEKDRDHPSQEREQDHHGHAQEQNAPEHKIADENREIPQHERTISDDGHDRLDKETLDVKQDKDHTHELDNTPETEIQNHDYELDSDEAIHARLEQEILSFEQDRELDDLPSFDHEDDDLEKFRQEFEEKNPELAKEIENEHNIGDPEEHAHAHQKQYDNGHEIEFDDR
ncbi:MAG: Ti-type conjugative transfer relaxase TraA [Gammaproteobacteria bacterium]